MRPTPFTIGPGPDTLTRHIEQLGLVRLATLMGLEINALQRIALLGLIESEERPILDFFLGIRPDAWEV